MIFQRARHKLRMFRPDYDSADRSVRQIIGFTARLLAKDDDAPKYIKHSQTVTYDKSRHVFGLTWPRKPSAKKAFWWVAEGNMDVIASWQAGVSNVVASAGTL